MLSEHFYCKYRVGAILCIENKFKINKHTKELSISAYIIYIFLSLVVLKAFALEA